MARVAEIVLLETEIGRGTIFKEDHNLLNPDTNY